MGGTIHEHRHLEIRELKSFSSIGSSTASLGGVIVPPSPVEPVVGIVLVYHIRRGLIIDR